jgi:hypothetical protein
MTEIATARPRPSNPGRYLAHLRRRRRAEARFRFYGMVAIAIALGLLALLIGSISARGYSAFTQTTIGLEINVVGEVDIIRTVRSAGYALDMTSSDDDLAVG